MTSDPHHLSFVVSDPPLKNAASLKELDLVQLNQEIDTKDGRLPRGSRGTVVLVWRGGEAFEVEFTQPFSALVTVSRGQISLASHRARR